MLTEEQIKKLKKGDECIAKLKFVSAGKSSLLFELPGMELIEISQRNRDCLDLPSEYTRSKGTIGTVLLNEIGDGKVLVEISKGKTLCKETIPFFHLDLVTPVEEQESFGVRYSTDRDCAEVYHRRYKNTVAAFYCKCGITSEQAEKAAEAERDRLNEEWRKENQK